jgi:tRNA pseudouridine13 synthase
MTPEHAPLTLADVWNDLPRAWGGACGHARVRGSAEDFHVTEIPVTEPDGEGEHAWLYVRKTGANTDWVAQALARHAGVSPMSVGYAGLKDRHAVTEQWFSVHLPGRPDPDWDALDVEGVEILRAARHSRKLKRGALKGNRFEILLRSVEGDNDCIEQRLQRIREQGVPNYFGAQRFGRDGGNLARADALFDRKLRASRHQRSLYLSAARSALFNRVLAARVSDGGWLVPQPGEVLQLDGRSACFTFDAGDETIAPRLANLDIHCTGPLYGKGDALVRDDAAQIEAGRLSAWPGWLTGLEKSGLEAARRSLRLRVEGLDWRWLEPQDDLRLSFTLTAGGFATAVLREICDCD